MQEIHTRFREVIDQGIVETTKESEVSTWPFPQEDNIDMECISIDEGPHDSPSPKSDSVCILGFTERPRDITNEGENLEYISHIEIWFQ